MWEISFTYFTSHLCGRTCSCIYSFMRCYLHVHTFGWKSLQVMVMTCFHAVQKKRSRSHPETLHRPDFTLRSRKAAKSGEASQGKTSWPANYELKHASRNASTELTTQNCQIICQTSSVAETSIQLNLESRFLKCFFNLIQSFDLCFFEAHFKLAHVSGWFFHRFT